MPTPRFAVLTSQALIGLGLKSLLERILPRVEVLLFTSAEELFAEERRDHFFHYFVEAELALSEERMRERLHRTILLTCGAPTDEQRSYHWLDINQSEAALVRDIMRIQHSGHPVEGKGAHRPKPERQLTAREAEVLRLLTRGLINKQIADQLGVSLTTVISHRRNLSRKLGIRSLSALTIYAVMNGYVDDTI